MDNITLAIVTKAYLMLSFHHHNINRVCSFYHSNGERASFEMLFYWRKVK